MDGQVRSHRGYGGKSISLGHDYIGCLLIPNATVSIRFTFEEFLIGSEKEPQNLDECRHSSEDLRAHDVERLSVFNGDDELFICEKDAKLGPGENVTWLFNITSSNNTIIFNFETTKTSDEDIGYLLNYTCK